MGQRGEKPYPGTFPWCIGYIREYHATRVRKQPKRFSEAGSVMFWVSLPGLLGDTGPNHCDRGTPLTN